MLKKLFKHDWKAVTKLLLTVHCLVLIIAVMGRITIELSGGFNSHKNPISILGIAFLIFYMLSIFCVAVFTGVYLAVRFYNHIFSNQGYLTNTLPVTTHQIILSQLFTGSIWFLIDFAFIAVSLMAILISPGAIIPQVGAVIEAISEYHLLPLILEMFLYILLSLPLALLTVYASIALGSLFSGHKVIGAIGCYMGIYAIEQVLSMVGMYLLTLNSGQSSNTAMESTARMVDELKEIGETCLYRIPLVLLMCAVFYFITWWIMNRKTNLD